MPVFTFCSIDRIFFNMKSETHRLNSRILCLQHWLTSSLLLVPNVLCGLKSQVLFYHHVVRKWSSITQIWTYLSEGTASQISKHLLSSLGAFHPFQNMALDNRKSKIVILQKEILRNRSRDIIWGPRGLDDLSSFRMQSRFFFFFSCSVISLKRPEEPGRFLCLFVCCMIGSNYFTISGWFLTYINLNWPEEYMCLPHPEHPYHLPP